MKEIREIIRAYDQSVKDGKQSALATVVHVEGSAYRRPGARMLVTDDGQLTGAISGGCLEGDALRKALQVITERRSRLVTYDTMDEDDAKFGVGLGCNGIIQVLFEPIDSKDEYNPIHLLKNAVSKRQTVVLVTLFSLLDKKDPQPGTCLLLNEEGIIAGKNDLLKEVLIQDAAMVFTNKQSAFKNYISAKHNLTAFIELIKPPITLVIAGAGNDAVPLVDMADVLGWETIVADGRKNYVLPGRFPKATRLMVTKPGELLNQLSVDEQTVFALLTHNYNYDKILLQQLINRKVTYAGMLGPRKKWQRMLDEWKEEGIVFTEEQLSIVHSPVGFKYHH